MFCRTDRERGPERECGRHQARPGPRHRVHQQARVHHPLDGRLRKYVSHFSAESPCTGMLRSVFQPTSKTRAGTVSSRDTTETDLGLLVGFSLHPSLRHALTDLYLLLGVLTKPDRIAPGDQESWLQYIRGRSVPLKNGWFSVKQPDINAIRAGITREEARHLEDQFFSTVPWNTLSADQRGRLGTYKLRSCLSDVLADAITQMYVLSSF